MRDVQSTLTGDADHAGKALGEFPMIQLLSFGLQEYTVYEEALQDYANALLPTDISSLDLAPVMILHFDRSTRIFPFQLSSVLTPLSASLFTSRRRWSRKDNRR